MHTIAPYAFCGLIQFNFTYIPHVQEGGERGSHTQLTQCELQNVNNLANFEGILTSEMNKFEETISISWG